MKDYEKNAKKLASDFVEFTKDYADPLSYTVREDEKYLTEWATFETTQYRYLEIKIKTPREVIDATERNTVRKS